MMFSDGAGPPPDKKSRLPTHLPLLIAILVLVIVIGAAVGPV